MCGNHSTHREIQPCLTRGPINRGSGNPKGRRRIKVAITVSLHKMITMLDAMVLDD
jgi:hypothetical protein